jgi:hypothetical protein
MKINISLTYINFLRFQTVNSDDTGYHRNAPVVKN